MRKETKFQAMAKTMGQILLIAAIAILALNELGWLDEYLIPPQVRATVLGWF